MLAEFEARTRIDDLERELRDVTEAGLVVVPERGQEKGRPQAVLPVVLAVALVVAACSGPPARAGESPTVPEVTATEAAAIPGMQDQVRIPAIGSEVTPGPTAEAVPATPKPLPEVISSDTLKEANRGTVVWTPEQTEAARAEAATSRGYKIPVPDKFFEMGGSVVPESNGRELALVLPESVQNFEFLALIKGQVVKVGQVGSVSNMVQIKDGRGLVLNIGFPLEGSKFLVKAGDAVEPQTAVFSAGHSKAFEDRRKSLGNPPNTVAVVALSNPDGSVFPLTKDNIQTDSSGWVVAIATSGKG